MPERRFWFFRTTIQAFCLVIEKGAVDYCVLSISLKPVSYTHLDVYKRQLEIINEDEFEDREEENE